MKVSSRRTAAAFTAILAAAPAAAQQDAPAPEAGAFVVTIGRDTLAVEKYTRTADRLTGEIVSRSPRTVHRSYAATLNPDGSVSRLELTSRPLSGGAVTTGTIVFAADSATWTVRRNDSTTTRTIAISQPAAPLVTNSHALIEQAVLQARAAGRADARFALVQLGGAEAASMTFRGVDGAEVALDLLSGPQQLTLDANGRLQSLDGSRSTAKFVAQRVQVVDMQGLESEFAALDASGRGMGPLSPRDSVVADVGGAHVAIDYGRPFKRGRPVLGGIIPYNQVWRTGANAATGLRTTRDLEIGGTTIPAGSYTLWTLPSPGGWKLIVNKETGQWGTDHDEAQDLARLDMEVGTVAQPVEQFTIAIDRAERGGVIRMRWDTTEVSIPFTVK